MSRLTSPLRRARLAPSRARGLATLPVVVLLLLVLSIGTAASQRALILEQRTAASQLRATQAFEAAEAGLEWAQSMLGGGRIDAACAPTMDPSAPTFRQRVLTLDPDRGTVEPVGADAAGAGTAAATCVLVGIGWSCQCPSGAGGPAPADAAPWPAPVAGDDPTPAFRVRFARAGDGRPGVVGVEVHGCTRPDEACLGFPGRGATHEGRASVRALLALRSGLAAPPVAAVTARGAVDAPLTAVNADARAAGLAVLAGGGVGPAVAVVTAAGSPAAAAIRASDPALASLADGARLFAGTFATTPDTWRDQPAAVRLHCADTPCHAAEVRAAAAARPGGVLWIDGDVDLDAGADLGTPGEPVVLVVTGRARIDIGVHGLVFGRAPDWAVEGGGRIVGALVAEGRVTGDGTLTVVHDAGTLERLRRATGSFVRVPGGWGDFR